MPRAPKNPPLTKAAQAAHAEKLRKRRERRHDKKTMEMASRAAEGESDFAALVEAERERLGDEPQQAKAGRARAGVGHGAAAREHLAKAFDLMGGVPALVVWGRMNPTEFYRLWSKMIPREAEAPTAAMPLEDLLSKLASKEEKSVAQAAYEVGMEALEAGRLGAEEEDRLAATAPGSDSVN